MPDPITEVKPTNWRDMMGVSNAKFQIARQILMDQIPVEGKDDEFRAADHSEKEQIEGLMEEAKMWKAKAIRLQELEAQMGESASMIATSPDQTPGVEQGESDDINQAKKARENGAPGAYSFKTWGNFLVAVWQRQALQGPPDNRLQRIKDDDSTVIKGDRKDLSATTGASGGFLIPDEFHEELMAAMVEASDIRQRATRIPMRRQIIKIPVLNQTGTTAGQPHFFGGMQFYWAAAATEKTSTDASFRQIQLEAHKLIGLTRAADELVDDSAISLAAFLSGPLGFAGGVAWMEEYAFYNGTGSGQPLGIINAPCTISEPRVTANTVDFDDFSDMLSKFLPSSNGLWTINQGLMSQVIQLNGPSGNPAYVWSANARDGIPNQILGYPVKWSEKVPVRGSAGDVSLADWSYYLIGDRQAQTIESTKYDRWAYDETSWRIVHRVDGQPWLSAALTLQDGTTQISPFVILSASATGT